MAKLDMCGKQFNRWTVLGLSHYNSRRNHKYFKCRCVCGFEKTISMCSLKSGASKSCGCWKKEEFINRITTHGKTKSRLYKVWCSIKHRCFNPRSKSYPDYGGRGITMQKELADSFEAFKREVGERPGSRHSIDRIDNEKGYVCGNMRWATDSEQSRNTRRNINITYNGTTQCLQDWATDLGMHSRTLHARLFKLKYSTHKAFTKPVSKKNLNINFSSSL